MQNIGQREAELAARAKKMREETERLNALVIACNRMFTNLENTLAALLHEVLFAKNKGEAGSRIAYAIYFTPEGFGQRQAMVNNAVTEWIVENPLKDFDFLKIWNKINLRLNTIRGTRNLLAHGSVQTVEIRGVLYTRVMPPVYAPKLGDAVAKGTIPGKSMDDMKMAEGALGDAVMCLMNMIRLLQIHDEDEQTLQETFDALTENLNLLNRWFPDAQKTQGC